MGALLVFPAFALHILNSVWVAIVFGILSTRFRDIGRLLTTSGAVECSSLTPIIWSADGLSSTTHESSSRLKIVEINPMFHYLEVAREAVAGATTSSSITGRSCLVVRLSAGCWHCL